MKNNTYRRLCYIILIAPAVIFFFGLYFWPLSLSLVSSFTHWNGFAKMEFIGFKNYIDLFKDENFRQAILNTLYASALGVVVHVPLGVALALVLSRKLRGWRFVRSVYMLPNIISGAGLALLFMFVFRPVSGLLSSVVDVLGGDGSINWLGDNRFAFIAVQLMWVLYAAVVTLITLADLLSLPGDMKEAALIDGANEFQVDWYINIPLIKRSIGTGLILTITSVFKTFDIIYMSTKGGPGNRTLNLAVMMINNVTKQTRYGYANAIGMILLIMGVIVMLIVTRLFRMNEET